MTNWKRITIIFILSVILTIAFYDVLAIYKGGTEASISHTIIVWSYRFPAFTFLFGFVMGHLFWRVKETKELASLLNKDE
jgi:hypothetical protein